MVVVVHPATNTTPAPLLLYHLSLMKRPFVSPPLPVGVRGLTNVVANKNSSTGPPTTYRITRHIM